MQDTHNATPGTGNRQLTPFQEVSGRTLCQYESIACQEGYRAFSVEEVRLEDYRQGKGPPPKETNTKLFTMSSVGLLNGRPRADGTKLDLYVAQCTRDEKRLI